MRAIFFSLLLPIACFAHEFWIEPEAYYFPSTGYLTANLKIGQGFYGDSLIYNKAKFARFSYVQGESALEVPIEGKLGDRPAIDKFAVPLGANIIIHETNGDYVLYQKAELFQKFIDEKALRDVAARHFERGLPKMQFYERYRRFAKSLIVNGPGVKQGVARDFPVGLAHEIVILDAITSEQNMLRARILENGAPRPDAQLEVFAKNSEGEVAIEKYRTDSEGVARFLVQADTEYMLNAVVMHEVDPNQDERGAVWESLWANLTFKTPKNQ